MRRGHMARANRQWRDLPTRAEVLAIFHGPHAYISPSNYDAHENVPTWNYGAVHVYGRATTYIETEQLLAMLHDLIPTFESAYAQQWESLGEAYRHRMLSHIVGFEIAVSKVEAKFKLSQNRTRDEQQRIIDSLWDAPDTAISSTARVMCEHGLGTKKLPVKKEKP